VQVYLYPVQEVAAITQGAEPAEALPYSGDLGSIQQPKSFGVRLTALEAPGHEIKDLRWRSMGSPGSEADAIERALICLHYEPPHVYDDEDEDGLGSDDGDGLDDAGEGEGNDADEGDDGEEGGAGEADGEGNNAGEGEGNVQGEGVGGAGAD
jgi:hypothetical protein